jgi:DNA polymerase-1
MFPFREVWCADFEYRSLPGERPRVACLVAQELIGGRQVRMWRDELQELRKAPFDTGPDALVAYYASAELGCFLELGWPLPANVIDLFAEHRVETNGRPSLLDKKLRNKLLGALAIRGLGHIDAGEKKAMIDLINSKEWWEFTEEERRSILDYCATDVAARCCQSWHRPFNGSGRNIAGVTWRRTPAWYARAFRWTSRFIGEC